MRLVRSGQWDADVLVSQRSRAGLHWLPAPADGIMHLRADNTRKDQCGRKHPLGLVTRARAHAPSCFGFAMVRLSASWHRYRIPIAIAVMDPKCTGHQHIVFRHMLETVALPSWVRQVIVTADAGCAANKTFQVIQGTGWTSVIAIARSRKCTDGR